MTDNLIEQLQAGVCLHKKGWSGDVHSDKAFGPLDVTATNELMARAAGEIERLEKEAIARDVSHERIQSEHQENLARWRRQMAALRTENERLKDENGQLAAALACREEEENL